MRLGSVATVVGCAVMSAGCFPNYETGEESVPADMARMRPSGAFNFSVDGASVQVQLDHEFAIDRDEVTIERYLTWVDVGPSGVGVPCEDGVCGLDDGGPYAGAMQWDSVWNEMAWTPHYLTVNDAGDCGADGHPGEKTT